MASIASISISGTIRSTSTRTGISILQGTNCWSTRSLRYENLEEDLGRISAAIGLSHNLHDDLKEIKAKSGIRPTQVDVEALIGPEEAALIGGLCSKEIESLRLQPGRYPREATGCRADARAGCRRLIGSPPRLRGA